VKQVLENSAVKPSIKAKNPGTEDMVELAEISKTGGIINAYEAAVLADKTIGNKTPAVVSKPAVKAKKPVTVKPKKKVVAAKKAF
jgi:hypothetical protein